MSLTHAIKSLFSTLGNFDATSAGAHSFPRALISLVPWPCLLGGLQPQAGEASGIECESFARQTALGGWIGTTQGDPGCCRFIHVWMTPSAGASRDFPVS